MDLDRRLAADVRVDDLECLIPAGDDHTQVELLREIERTLDLTLRAGPHDDRHLPRKHRLQRDE